jgi:hypothetical protein
MLFATTLITEQGSIALAQQEIQQPNNNTSNSTNMTNNSTLALNQTQNNITNINSNEVNNTNLVEYQKDHNFVHGIVVNLNGSDYYFDGPTDAKGGAKDAPGHYWRQVSSDHIYGLHYNTGPFGETNWWSSDAKGDELLYLTDAIIAPWTNETATDMAKNGYVHYHEFVRTDNGEKHPTLVAWFKHVAIPKSFTLDKGADPTQSHKVEDGIDYKFLNNYNIPYDPNAQHQHAE